MLVETTMVEDVALHRIPAMKEKETVMDLEMEVNMMDMLAVRETLSADPTTVESSVSTTTRRTTVVSDLVLVEVETLVTRLVRPTGPSGAASAGAV